MRSGAKGCAACGTVLKPEWYVQVMAQSERLYRLAAERRALVEAALAADVSGALAGMQDRGAALSAAILDAEARITSVLRQKRDGQSNRGARP